MLLKHIVSRNFTTLYYNYSIFSHVRMTLKQRYNNFKHPPTIYGSSKSFFSTSFVVNFHKKKMYRIKTNK